MTSTAPPPPEQADDAPGKRLLGGRWAHLPLIAIVVVALWLVFDESPQAKRVTLVLGAAGELSELAVNCEDEAGLDASARWSFEGSHPPSVDMDVLTSGPHYRCEVVLRNAEARRSVSRNVEFRGDAVRILLQQELVQLGSNGTAE